MWPFKKKIVSKKSVDSKSIPKLNPGEIMADCGHPTQTRDKIFAFGEDTTTTIRLTNGKTDYCHRCLEKMAIQCAWCDKPIFIGDPITLYTPSGDFKIPEHAVIYSQDPLQLVGCGRTTCADTGADYCGTWLPEGVHRVQSLLEEAMATGEPAINNNLLGSRE